MKSTILLLFLVPPTVCAQSAVRVEVGTSSQAFYESDLRSNWDTGILFGAAVDIALADQLLLTPGVQFSTHSFDAYNHDSNAYPASTGTPSTATGTSSKLFRFYLELRFVTSRLQAVNFGLSLGGGSTIEQLGTIHVIWTYNGLVLPERTVTYASRTYVMYTSSFFAKLEPIDRISLVGSVRCFANIKDRLEVVPTIGFQWYFRAPEASVAP